MLTGPLRFALIFLVAALPSRSGAAATVQGVVTTSGGASAPVRGARVVLFDAALSVFVEARSDAEGAYRIDVAPGGYRIGTAARGYAYTETTIALGSAGVQQDFALEPETEPGRWATIGDTSPEQLGGSNSGSLLADGTLLFCHNTRDSVRFDPVGGLKGFPADSGDFQGCAAITLLGTGELLFVGGQKSADFRDATTRVKSFDTWTGAWHIQPSLNQERWYPALARLADGSLLVCGGAQRPAAERTATCERWDRATRLWSLTASMAQPSEYSPMALLHDGEVLKTWFPPELYDPLPGEWRSAATTVQHADRAATYPDHCDHSLVVLRNGEALAVGILPAAGSPTLVMVEHYEPCAGTWRLGGGATVTRSRPEVVPLPDGRVFVAGGRLEVPVPTVFTNDQGYVRLADLYDPSTETWRSVAEMRVAREYHATSVLLPDERVLVTAGAGSVGLPSPDMGIDAYSPPYMYRGPRPVIERLSTTALRHGDALTIDVSLAPAVTGIVMMGAQANTHYVDGAVPRRLALPFTQIGNRVQARVPASSVAAPEGYYILFAMVDDVPSEGRLVRLDATAGSPAPDRIGDALTAAPAGDDLVLDWRHGPLNPSRYSVYRSTAAADLQLLPQAIGARSPVAAVTEETWTDKNAWPAAGETYFYRVLGRRCDGSAEIP